MAAKNYFKHLFKVIDKFIIYLMPIHAWTWDCGELNFDKSFLQFNVKKKIYVNISFWADFKCWILDATSLSS